MKPEPAGDAPLILRILVVDGDPAVRRSTRAALRQLGTVAVAGSVGEASRAMRAGGFDVVMFSLDVPGGTSLDLAQKARARLPDARLIVTLDLDSMESVVRAMRLGATDYLEKPFTPARAREAVSSVHSDPHQGGSARSLGRLGELVIAAQEFERHRIARDLHDAASQSLASLGLGLGRLARRAPEELRGELLGLRDLSLSITDEVLALVRGLRPIVLDELGFEAAIEHLVTSFDPPRPMAADLAVVGQAASELPHSVQTGLYRVTQEALNNVARHSRASVVSVVLEHRPDRVRVIVEDDGRGFRPDASRSEPSFGLAGMQERLRMLGGDLTIESAPGEGATIYASVPL